MAKTEIKRTTTDLARQRANLPKLKKGEQLPVFSSLFGSYPADKIPNPIEKLEIGNGPTADAEQEVSAVLQAILDEKAVRRDQYRTMLDTEFWCCLCFQNREQKEAFLTQLGILHLGDKYLDGLAVAQRLNLDVPPIPLQAKAVRKAPVSLREEVIDS